MFTEQSLSVPLRIDGELHPLVYIRVSLMDLMAQHRQSWNRAFGFLSSSSTLGTAGTTGDLGITMLFEQVTVPAQLAKAVTLTLADPCILQQLCHLEKLGGIPHGAKLHH